MVRLWKLIGISISLILVVISVLAGLLFAGLAGVSLCGIPLFFFISLLLPEIFLQWLFLMGVSAIFVAIFSVMWLVSWGIAAILVVISLGAIVLIK